MLRSEKAFVVVVGSLSPGQQLAQSTHAAMLLAAKDPTSARLSLVMLSTKSVGDLEELCARLELDGYSISRWREPDLGDALTAAAFVAVAPRLTRGLPLALG